MELEKSMKQTTQNLESKLSKAVEINEADEEENDYGDEEEVTFDETGNFAEPSESFSIEREEFEIIGKGINLKNQNTSASQAKETNEKHDSINRN